MLPVFPAGREDLYGFLPKIGMKAIKPLPGNVPKLILLQWAIECLVVFQDNPYVFEFDEESRKRLEVCIFEQIPSLEKLLFGSSANMFCNTQLTKELIREQHLLAENLLRRAMQINDIPT
jgi:hypothetical protein